MQPTTHDLLRLLSLMPTVLGLQTMQAHLAFLSVAAVEFRYPGEQASRAIAKEAIHTSRAVRMEIRMVLGIEG